MGSGDIITFDGVAFRVTNHHHLKFDAHTFADFLQFAFLGHKIRLPSKSVFQAAPDMGITCHVCHELESESAFFTTSLNHRFVINTYTAVTTLLQNFKDAFESNDRR